MKKEKLIIMLDFIFGPLWEDIIDPITYEFSTGIDVVDNDEELQTINDEISALYSSYYKFDYNDEACFFDFEQEKKDKKKMLKLFKKLFARLDEINDGSFEIEDRETDRIRKL